MSEQAGHEIESLRELFRSAGRQASEAMTRWTGGRVSLISDTVRELPLDRCDEQFGTGDEPQAIVIVPFGNRCGGLFLFRFDDRDGLALAAALLGRDEQSGDGWGELEKSVAMETGNILASAYLGVMTEFVGGPLIPSPPIFVRDFAASVLQQALTPQAEERDQVLLCRTRFGRDGRTMNGNVLFLPGEALSRKLTAVSELSGHR